MRGLFSLWRSVVLSFVVGLTLLACANTSVSGQTACDKWASPLGSDRFPGTLTAPFRSPDKLASSLADGQTGCLRAGTYGTGETWTIRNGGKATARITLMSAPGETATIYKQTYLPNGTNFVTLKNVKLDGSRNPKGAYGLKAPLNIAGDDNQLLSSEVRNRNAAQTQGGICVYLGASSSVVANRTLLQGNRVHACGVGTNMRMHGVYVNWAHDTVLAGNYFYDISGKGASLYRDADRTILRGSVFHRTGTGILVGSGDGFTTDNAVIRNNVISNPLHNNEGITEWWETGLGRGNKVYDNCLWPSKSIKPRHPSGITYTNNVYSDPAYVDASTANFTVTSSTCKRKLQAGW